MKTGEEQKYLLTGATGFLGSHIMAALLQKGTGLCVAGRPSGNEPLKERIRKLLAWFGIDHLIGLIQFYETDFLKVRLGLGEVEYEDLCNKGLTIIHCASDTSFTERDRERVMKSNVQSLSEILNFACKSNTPYFHFISTAFAAGTDLVDCTESPVISDHFTNVYEESKAQAEKIISGKCNREGIPYTIMRPSIIYGDSVTGRSIKFNALYVPVRSLQAIRDIYLADIKKNNGLKAAECGIYMNEEGILHLPLKIFIPCEGSINLIPVDYFTAIVLKILKKPESGTIYHITGKNPENLERLAVYTQKFLDIKGIDVIIGHPGPEETRNPAEELFDHFIKPYIPYISDRRIFIRNNTDKATPGVLPPDLSYEIFQRCMDFAVSVDWGKNLFSSEISE